MLEIEFMMYLFMDYELNNEDYDELTHAQVYIIK